MTINLSGIEEACEAATPGRWIAEYSKEQGHCVVPEDAESTREAVCTTRLFRQSADAEFIATARTALPALAKALRAVLELHRVDAGCGNPVHTDPTASCPDCVSYCKDDGFTWPCTTVRAITDAGITLGGSES